MLHAPVPVFQYYIDPERSFIWTRFSGQLTDETLLEFLDHLYALPEWQEGYNELADFREAHGVRLTPKAIRKVADISLTREKTKNLGVLAQGRLNLGLLRMFLSYADGSNENVQVFQEPADACEFLGIDQIYPPADWVTFKGNKAKI